MYFTLKPLALVMLLAFTGCMSVPANDAPVPETTRAVAFDKGGGPEVLYVHQVPVPKPKAREVLIAVQPAVSMSGKMQCGSVQAMR
jgi:hypothetical protein